MHYAETYLNLVAVSQLQHGSANAAFPHLRCHLTCYTPNSFPWDTILGILSTYKELHKTTISAKHNALSALHCFGSTSPAIHTYICTSPTSTFKKVILPSPMSYSSYNSGAATWQERLEEKCREANYHPPVFQIMSDRRGGRTAWSSTVTVQGQSIPARFWYDGDHVNNAKEDAAEVALKHISTSNPGSPTQSRSGW
ncbi:hypothetical protein ONS96_009238 [Cadophora gregata f. sp. sojae]|nr:hypothetical protein ONS96_009238 [Cadophora gregata f. sp. sojae]